MELPSNLLCAKLLFKCLTPKPSSDIIYFIVVLRLNKMVIKSLLNMCCTSLSNPVHVALYDLTD